MENIGYLITLAISDLLIIILWFILKKQKNNQITNCFRLILIFMFIWTFSLTLQLLFQKTLIAPAFFECLASFGAELLPLSVLFLGIIFTKSKIVFEKKYILLLVIPTISIILMVTNNLHHLYYIEYSTALNNTIYGPYMLFHSVYTYIIFGIALVLLLRYSIKNSGFFSKQAIFIVLAAIAPIGINIIGYLGLFPMTVYMTPISFAVTIFFLAIAIFKFKLFGSTPIALQRIVDRISDGYLVLDENDVITDFNNTFLKMFHLNSKYIRGRNLFGLLEEKYLFSINDKNLRNYIDKVKNSEETIHFEKKLINEEKYFNIEINSIQNDKAFLGVLILFKDTTQHIVDMQTIQNNQNMLMERERLASLGQLIGGIAHNLKTPIMSIAGAAEGLSDLIKEYESSVGDPEVTIKDHHDIAKDMKDWIEKVKSYTEYMSDIITAVKGQAVTMSEEQAVSFTIDELVKRVDILMRHELKNALISLNVYIKTDKDAILKGNINSLVQVINNMISNSIQAYNGKTNEQIDLTISKEKNNILISIKDYGSGLPVAIQKKLFKQMITTKGKNGTGLGLFMSYSTIRANFNGNISFESSKGKGTTFIITLPVLI